MSRTLRSTLTAMILVLTFIHPAAAQTPHSPRSQRATPYWDVTYWNNTSLSGDPAARVTDPLLDHDWGLGSPLPDVNADQFSARWAGTVELTGGRYRFTAVADDGIRVTVDGALVIDEWTDHPRRRFTADTDLPSGAHRITVEYYENGGEAVAQVSWDLAPTVPSPWHGAYYANRHFEGPTYERLDDTLDFDWGYGSPAPGIPSDGFSVSWWRNVTFSAGTYRFTASSDDGIEVYLYRLGETTLKRRDVIDDAWYDHAEQTFVGEVDLKEGDYRVVVKYYENTGLATARVTWSRVSGFPTGWTGEYFDNVSFDDVPTLIRQDEEIDFDWGYGSPARGIVGERFSVRWTRTVDFEPGVYLFTASTDDGVRLWVDDRLLIDNWHDQAVTPHSATGYVRGETALKMEYYENRGLAAARLTWERVGPEPSPPATGTVIVDDTDPGFVRTGPWCDWQTADEGYGGHLAWSWNTGWLVRWQWPGPNMGRWTPDLAPGRYEVFAYVPERYSTSSQARYVVAHRDGRVARIIDQSTSGDTWVSLGTYWFGSDGEECVSLSTPTREVDRSRLLAFDAVKWVPR